VLVLNGIFRDNIFVPDGEVFIPDGTKAIVSIEEPASKTDSEPSAGVEMNVASVKGASPLVIMQQKKAWRDFFEGIRTADDELPAEFDQIIEKGITFDKVDFL